MPAEIIDALLIHGEMRITNLAGLLKRDVRTIYSAEAKLRKAGATTLNGGLLSLKRCMDEPQIMTLGGIADFLKVHRSTLYRLIKQRKLPVFRIGSD